MNCAKTQTAGLFFGLLLALASAPAIAQADENASGATAETAAAASAPSPPAATTSPAAQEGSPAASGSLDFDLFADQPKPDPAAAAAAAAKAAAVDRQIHVRRNMLRAHTALGFATLGVMAATVILGQVNYVARYGSLNNGNDYDRFQSAHLGLSISTTAMFTALGVLGVAAPNPYPKPIKLDPALVHKICMILATAGMVTQMILGPVTAAYEGKVEQRNLALGHVITGYATWGFMATGMLAYVF